MSKARTADTLKLGLVLILAWIAWDYAGYLYAVSNGPPERILRSGTAAVALTSIWLAGSIALGFLGIMYSLRGVRARRERPRG